MYDNQPGVGIEGDLANDFKYQFVGIVYHDIVSGLSEYLGQGSGWVHLPVSDTTGSRVMPPFSGPGNGGWTTAGGPLMTLKGKETTHVDIFVKAEAEMDSYIKAKIIPFVPIPKGQDKYNGFFNRPKKTSNIN